MQHKPLNICLVTGDFPALTETFITTKALELAARGHSITIISNRSGGALNESYLPAIKQAGIKVLEFPNLSSGKEITKSIVSNPGSFINSLSTTVPSVKRKYLNKLQAQLLTSHSFDIIHFEFSGLAIVYQGILETLKGKKVVSCRGTAEKVKPLSEKGRGDILRNLFSEVDAIHCVSDDMAETVSQYMNGTEKIFVNRPSINTDVFKRKENYRNGHFELVILSIGRFTFQKGYLQGLLAMQALRKRGLPIRWKIVGDGPQKEEIMYHIHTLGLHDCVELLGKKNRDEILQLYNEVDVFLLPSIYEGIANVCLEAMAMELPVVATKSGGMEEVIVHGKNGLLCEIYSPASIEEQLLVVANDFEKRNELGIQARKTVVENFTIQKQADIFEAQYYRLVNKHS